MSVDKPIAEPPTRSRFGLPAGMRAALLGSLALNALFIGGLVSAYVRHGGAPFHQSATQRSLGAYVSTLPADRSAAIWRKVTEMRRELAGGRQEVRQARDAALAALTADPFDKAKFVAAETRMIEVDHAHRLNQRDVLAEIAGSMTPEERRNFLRWRGPSRPVASER